MASTDHSIELQLVRVLADALVLADRPTVRWALAELHHVESAWSLRPTWRN